MASPDATPLDIPCRGLPVLSLYYQGTARGSTIALDTPCRGLPVLDLYVSPLPTAFSSSLSSSATISRTGQKSLSATISGTGSLARTGLKSLSATVSGTGSLARTVSRPFTAILSQTAELARVVGKGLSATLTGTGALGRALTRPLDSTIAGTAALTRTASRFLGATVAPSATLSRKARKVVQATLHGVADLASTVIPGVRLFVVEFTATLSMEAEQHALVRRPFSATQTAAARLGRQIARPISTALSVRGAFVKIVARPHAADMSSGAEVRHSVQRPMQAALAGMADLSRSVQVTFEALLPLRGERYVAFYRPFVRGIHRLLRHVWPLTPQMRAQKLYAPPRVQALAPRPRTFQLIMKEGQMKLIPSGPSSGELFIEPRAENISFSVEYKDVIPTGSSIVACTATARILDSDDDVTNAFIAQTAFSGTQVKVVVGNGQQELAEVYRVSLDVTLNNAPPSVIPGFFDLPCQNG